MYTVFTAERLDRRRAAELDRTNELRRSRLERAVPADPTPAARPHAPWHTLVAAVRHLAPRHGHARRLAATH